MAELVETYIKNEKSSLSYIVDLETRLKNEDVLVLFNHLKLLTLSGNTS